MEEEECMDLGRGIKYEGRARVLAQSVTALRALQSCFKDPCESMKGGLRT